MEALVNQGKTRGFNCMLRVLHYGLLLLIVNRSAKASPLLCSESSVSYHHLLYIVNLILVIVAILGVCYIHFKYQFPRIQFFVILIVQTILIGIIVWYSLSAISNQQRECMQVILQQKWAIFASARLIIQVLAVMIFNLYWIQRYTNGPGNLIWSYMFLTINWVYIPIVQNFFTAIGITYLIISIITLVLNLVSRKADSPTFSKYLSYWWKLAIIIMFIFEGFAIAKLLSNDFKQTFYEVGAKKMLYIFVIGNLLDILFWGWGLLTLRVESGDVVRQGQAQELQEEKEKELEESEYFPQKKHVIVNELGTVFR